MIRWTTKVKVSGPVFNGVAEREVGRYLEETLHEIGEVGQAMIRADFVAVHRYESSPPTGMARARVTVTDEPGYRTTIGDGGLVYGPWLEGVGSRNKVTRFKGYATFRRIGQRLDARARDIALDLLPRFINRMNGGA